jgi:hypothetical protein
MKKTRVGSDVLRPKLLTSHRPNEAEPRKDVDGGLNDVQDEEIEVCLLLVDVLMPKTVQLGRSGGQF